MPVRRVILPVELSTGHPGEGGGAFFLVYKKHSQEKRFLLGKYLNNIWQAGLDMLFPPPPLCRVCGRKLVLRTRIELCQRCLEKLPLVGESYCRQCGRPVAAGKEPLCFDCRSIRHFFVSNRAVGIYSGILKEQIYEVKYRYNRQLGIGLGQVMALVAKARGWIPPSAHLLAVPLHPQRLRQRGYNQAELLIRGMQDCVQVPALKPGVVVRREVTQASSSLTPLERRANLRGAFYVPRPGQVVGKVLCVVDDIYTTGATLDELARTLLQAGAKAVYGLTLSIAVDDYDLVGFEL